MKLALYQSAETVQAALNAAFDSDTERTDTIEAVKGQFDIDAQSTIAYLLNREAMTGAFEEQIKQAEKKLKQEKAKLDSMRHAIGEAMIKAGVSKIESDTGAFTASVRKSSAVEIFDEAQIPAEFMREVVLIKPDKTAIKEAIKSGQEVDGAKIETRQNLQIK